MHNHLIRCVYLQLAISFLDCILNEMLFQENFSQKCVPTPGRGVILYVACRVHSCLGESVFVHPCLAQGKQREYMLRVEFNGLCPVRDSPLAIHYFLEINAKEIIHSWMIGCRTIGRF